MKVMPRFLVAAVIALGLAVATAAADPAITATPFIPIDNELPPELSVGQPMAGPLARGAVILPYTTKHFRILPVFGPGAADVSPRAGHLHVSVDDLPWRWADTGDNNAVVVVGLSPGPHKILIELATPEHRVVAGQAVDFVVPPPIASDAAPEPIQQH
jgi:hypothetical protein